MKINEILSICYDFAIREKDVCLNSSRMSAMFDIPHNFWSCVKVSTHMMNSTRAKIFVPPTTLKKFRFHSLRNKMINLVLVVQYHFDFRLQFDINKKCVSKVLLKSYLIMVHLTTWDSFLSNDQKLLGKVWVQ